MCDFCAAGARVCFSTELAAPAANHKTTSGHAETHLGGGVPPRRLPPPLTYSPGGGYPNRAAGPAAELQMRIGRWQHLPAFHSPRQGRAQPLARLKCSLQEKKKQFLLLYDFNVHVWHLILPIYHLLLFLALPSFPFFLLRHEKEFKEAAERQQSNCSWSSIPGSPQLQKGWIPKERYPRSPVSLMGCSLQDQAPTCSMKWGLDASYGGSSPSLLLAWRWWNKPHRGPVRVPEPSEKSLPLVILEWESSMSGAL